MGNALFVDMSSFQDPAKLDWAQYKAWSAQGDGVSRVLLRDDQGVGDPDSAFEQFWAAATATGIDEIFVYHYAYPNLHPGAAGALQEAQSMEQVIGHRLRANDKVMLDLEQNENSAWALYFGLEMQKWHPTASKPVLYDSLARLQQFLSDPALAQIYDLALADWTYDPASRPASPAPWPSYVWLQYTDKLTAAWYAGGTEGIDANVFLGGTASMPQGPFVFYTVGKDGVPSGLTPLAISEMSGLTVSVVLQLAKQPANYEPTLAFEDGTEFALPGFPQPAPAGGEPLADAAKAAVKAWLAS